MRRFSCRRSILCHAKLIKFHQNRYQFSTTAAGNNDNNTENEQSDSSAKNIGDFFTALGSKPDPKLQAHNATTKQYLRSKYANTLDNESNLRAIWTQLFEKIMLKKDHIYNNNFENIIPCIPMNTILNCKDSNNFTDLTNTIGNVLRETGVFIIRDVIAEKEALSYKESVLEYINENNGKIGFPENNPQVYEIYWSKAQIQARQHPNMVTAMRFANHLWSFDDSITKSIDGHIHSVEVPFCYVDRLRIREPGDTSFTLGCHIDGGSIERWKDKYYSLCYENIFNGNISKYSGFDASYRIFASMDHYNSPNNCSVFRTFQGWLSLSNCKPKQGSLQVNPMLNEATSYLMLRPFIKQDFEFKNRHSDDDDTYKIEAILDDSEFGNIYGGKGLDINEKFHKILCDTMVPIPEVNPGDLVLWHCDTIHKVDNVNENKTDSSVFYIPTCFDCDINHNYGIKQKEHFIKGLTPPDFPQQHVEKKFKNRATLDDLTQLGELIMHI